MNTQLTATGFQNGYALVIGVDENKVSGYELPVVGKDVENLVKVLAHPERCGYGQENLKVITGPAATKAGILEGIKWLKDKLDQDETDNETAVIYYSGHGHIGSDNKHYFIPYDVTSDVTKSALKAEKFAKEVRGLRPSRLFVVLDCCHAGASGVKGKIGTSVFALKSTAINTETTNFGQLSDGQGRAILSSSKSDQNSYTRKDKKMSIFTYHLVEALYGYSKPVGGGSKVRVSDLLGYVSQHVPATTKSEYAADQIPVVSHEGENFPIALLMGGKGVKGTEDLLDPITDSAITQVSVNITSSGVVSLINTVVSAPISIGYTAEDTTALLKTMKELFPDGKAPDELRKLVEALQNIHEEVSQLKTLHHHFNEAIIQFGPIKSEVQRLDATHKYHDRRLILSHWDMLKYKVNAMRNLPGIEWVDKFINAHAGMEKLLSEIKDDNAERKWKQLMEETNKVDHILLENMTQVDERLKDAIEKQFEFSRDAIGGLVR